MSILPLVNPAHLANWLIQYASEEGMVNGLWNSILNYHFRNEIAALQYSINPEVALGNGFPDLLVTKNAFDLSQPLPASYKWQIVFEGKASDGDSYENTIKQLEKYAKKVTGGSGWCYLIAARGSTCMFWRYKKNDTNYIQPMRVNGGVVQITTDISPTPFFPLSELYSLASVPHRQDIQTMLTYITNNPQQ